MTVKSWLRSKPDDWDEYQWEYLRTLNGLSYQLKVLGDRLDAIDSSTAHETLEAIINTTAIEVIKCIDRKNGHYSNSNQNTYNGFYDGSN